MKAHVIRSSAFLALIVGFPALSLGQATIPARDLRQNLFSVCFQDPREGWTVGDLGRIFHTVDGGQSWRIHSAGTKRPFVAISCVGDKLWVAGQGGQIAHSPDGGFNWQSQPSGTTRNLLDIEFVNLDRGLAVGDFGTLLRTEDGGKTWTRVSLPENIELPPDIAEVVQPGDVILYSIAFADEDHVWIVGEFGVILFSRDGGLTWEQQKSGVETTLFGVAALDTQRAWAVGMEAVMLATEDGGATWAKQTVPMPKGFVLPIYDVAVRGLFGWAVGNSGLLLYSQDAGKSWKLYDIPVRMAGSWFRGISLFPDGRGYIVGSRGLVLAVDREKMTPLKENY
ncbi:MAG: YCF48-related protein [Candidatus Binatia bacterium]|nr:YCF48-related protein [Candidatus Binatia bacterium]